MLHALQIYRFTVLLGDERTVDRGTTKRREVRSEDVRTGCAKVAEMPLKHSSPPVD